MRPKLINRIDLSLPLALITIALTCTVGAALANSPQATRVAAVAAHAKDGAGWDTVQKLVKTFKTAPLDDSKHESKVAAAASFPAAADLIDFNQIAMRSVGKSQWQTLSSAQKDDLTATIKALVQNRYYPRWQKIFGKGDVTYVSQSRNAGDIMVNTNLRLGHKDEPLVWQLSGDAQKPKVISLGVNDKDLLTKLSSRIQAHESKGGYKAMIAWLKGKGKADTAAGATAPSGSGDDAMTAAKPADLKGLKTSARTIDLID